MPEENEQKTTQQDFPKKEFPNLNPEGRGGFGDHPENRNPGGWKPEFTFSYQYRRFLNMDTVEFEIWIENNSKRTVVEEAAYYAVKTAKDDLKNRIEITDRTEGKTPQTMVVEGGFFTRKKLEIDIVDKEEENESTPTG